MNELINITYNSERPTVSGRDLHDVLQVKTAYKDWFPRMCEYGFLEGVDFNPLKNERVHMEGDRQVTRTVTDHQLTIAMAKEICMLQRTERGKECRQYFIKVEEQWNSPDAIMQRALLIANSRVEKLRGENLQLQKTNATLTVDKAIMQPKADYFDELVERGLLTNFRETAKQLGIPPKKFVNWLIEHKYLYRDKKGKLLACENKNNGLFELKECVNERTQWAGVQTLVTPKGRETFRLLCQGLAS